VVHMQIHLTAPAKRALEAMAVKTGKSKSELIRKAVDAMIERPTLGRASLVPGRGMWGERPDLPDFGALRDELDPSPAGP
jgi:hypothetical protein